MTLDDRIRGELDRVKDPCSVASGRPTGLVEMGLVLGWEVRGRVLHITFCVTFPGCTMAPHFIEAAREALVQFPEFDRVETSVDTDHVWRRPAGLKLAQMEGEPQAWRNRAAVSQG